MMIRIDSKHLPQLTAALDAVQARAKARALTAIAEAVAGTPADNGPFQGAEISSCIMDDDRTWRERLIEALNRFADQRDDLVISNEVTFAIDRIVDGSDTSRRLTQLLHAASEYGCDALYDTVHGFISEAVTAADQPEPQFPSGYHVWEANGAGERVYLYAEARGREPEEVFPRAMGAVRAASSGSCVAEDDGYVQQIEDADGAGAAEEFERLFGGEG